MNTRATATATPKAIELTEDHPEVIKLAKELELAPSKVISMINNAAYRKAYNRVNADRQKALRKLVRENKKVAATINELADQVVVGVESELGEEEQAA